MTRFFCLLLTLICGVTGCDSKSGSSPTSTATSPIKQPPIQTEPKSEAKKGDRFPTIKSASLDGNETIIGPEFYGKKATLVVFWSTWCGACMSDLPHEIELAKRFEEQGFRVIGINGDNDPKTAKQAVVENEITWPNFFEGKELVVSNHLGVKAWPALFLLDSDGIIVETTDLLRRTATVEMPDGTVQSIGRLDTFIAKLLESKAP